MHRSQGGEFPAVVLPLVTQHWPMLQRAIENAEQSARESGLAERLRRLLARAPDLARPARGERERD